ncbi:SGNH/GDSL hydrolase family protein [Corynebacterium sp. zg-331]|nr:SGNH/GDSL hydrolase family protein [Corynebacterium sp. zg-331]MPV52259.1 SGNH/GDSL hydrolase family protein [Corynebacterium sp. zg331]
MKAAAVTAASALALSVAAPVAGALPGAPLSSGQPQGAQLVAFGDSFTAHAGKLGGRYLEPARAPYIPFCSTDKQNWPKLIAERTGRSLADWSCNGTGRVPVADMASYLESAIAKGDLGPATQDVVIMYGGMTPLLWADVPVEAVTPHGLDFTPYRLELRAIKERIRTVAPHARVTLASYPELLSGDFFCPANQGSAQLPMLIPGGKVLQDTMRDEIRDTARGIGANFIDVYQASLGHGMCNPDPAQRWTVGFVDDANHTMPMHPSDQGQRAMADIISAGLYG